VLRARALQSRLTCDSAPFGPDNVDGPTKHADRWFVTTPPTPDGFVREVPVREEFVSTSYGLDEADDSWWQHVPDWLRVDNTREVIPPSRWSLVGVRAAAGVLAVVLAFASIAIARVVTSDGSSKPSSQATPEIDVPDQVIQQRTRTQLEDFSQRVASLRLRPTVDAVNQFTPLGVTFALPADAVLHETSFVSRDTARVAADGGWNQNALVPVSTESSTQGSAPTTTRTPTTTTTVSPASAVGDPSVSTTALAPQNSIIEAETTTIPTDMTVAPSTFGGFTSVEWRTASSPTDSATVVFGSIIGRAVVSDITTADQAGLPVRVVTFAPIVDGWGETGLTMTLATATEDVVGSATTSLSVRRDHQLIADTNPPLTGWATEWLSGLPTESSMKLVEVRVSSKATDALGAPLPTISATWLSPYQSRDQVSAFIDQADFGALGFQRLAVDDVVSQTTLSNRREFTLGMLPAYADVLSDANEQAVGTVMTFTLETDCPLSLVEGDASTTRELCQ
jgi:hypothetical protein